MSGDVAALRRVAEDAMAVTALAAALDFDGWDVDLPSEIVQHFAAFDPPTAIRLLDRLEAAEAALRERYVLVNGASLIEIAIREHDLVRGLRPDEAIEAVPLGRNTRVYRVTRSARPDPEEGQ